MFEDREDAANKICPKLKKYSDRKDTVVVGLTRGGIITAKVIADFLKLKLKALIIKKIPASDNEEFAIGAMISSKDIYWNKRNLKNLNIKTSDKLELINKKEIEIKQQEKKLKIKRTKDEYKNKNVILVDDGVATGASVIAAALYLRKNKAKRIILATPVIAFDTLTELKKYFDSQFYLIKSKSFYAVGEFYKNFEQISNEKVAKILNI